MPTSKEPASASESESDAESASESASASESESDAESDESPPPGPVRVPRAPVVVGGLAMLALVLLKISPLTFVDPDLWHQMSLAREMWTSGQLPLGDSFSYTPTVSPVVHHEWGAGFIWWGAASAGGAAGFLAFKYLLVLGVLALTVLAARRRGAAPATLVACALPAVLLSHYGFTTIRPQLLSMLALAFLLGLLAPKVGRRQLWLWLPVQLVWINVHAGFVVGLGFLGFATVERALRREPWIPLAAITVASSSLVLLNPWGLDYVTYLASGLFMERPGVTEWAPLWADLRLRWADLAAWTSMLVVALYALRARGLRGCRGISLVAITFLQAILHQRHVTLLAITWFAIVPAWLASTPLERALRGYFARRARWIVALGAVGALVLGAGAALRAPWRLRIPTDEIARAEGWPTYPVGAADYLEENHFRGNLMTPFVEGAYMMWRLHPQGVQISFDGRYEVAYQPGVFEAHQTFYSGGEGWYAVLTQYPTDLVLVPRIAPVLGQLLALPGWRVVYGDDLYVLVAPSEIELPFADRRGREFPSSFP